VPLVMPL